MMRSIAAAALAVSILLAASAGLAQSSEELGALRKEVEALKARQDAMLKELQEIRTQLRQRPAAQGPEPRDIALSIAGAPVKGDPRARLVLIDFSDYQ
jgi:hypothetical protein